MSVVDWLNVSSVTPCLTRSTVLAACIVIGTAMLSMGESERSGDRNTLIGVVCIVASLAMDGITAGLQKRIQNETQAATTYDFLYYTSCAMAATALLVSVATGDWTAGWAYCWEHPLLARRIVVLCICSSIGQSFIFFVICNFDTAVCATVTTTRKMASVVWSVSTKGHVLSPGGWGGLGLALVGVVMELRRKITGPRKAARGAEALEEESEVPLVAAQGGTLSRRTAATPRSGPLVV